MQAGKHFFDTVRPIFGGHLYSWQVNGMSDIVKYGDQHGYPVEHVAYALATTKKETANWMQPLREGGGRKGPAYTDEQAKRAVASLYKRGIISTNYALPAGPYKQSYYGRGLIQLTWYDNYRKFTRKLGVPLDEKPDLALDTDIALQIMFIGLKDGMFRKRLCFSDFNLNTHEGAYRARDAVNSDRTRSYGALKNIGSQIADDHMQFLKALKL